MNWRAKRTLFVVATLAVALAIAAARAPQGPAQQPPAGPGPKMAEDVFKNIQVLKGVPADQLFPTMQFISASLGVECEHCHVGREFQKDDKQPKQTARKMMPGRRAPAESGAPPPTADARAQGVLFGVIIAEESSVRPTEGRAIASTSLPSTFAQDGERSRTVACPFR